MLDDSHHLVPLTFDVGEHRVGLIGQAGLTDDANGVGDRRRDAAGVVGSCGTDAEGDEHPPSVPPGGNCQGRSRMRRALPPVARTSTWSPLCTDPMLTSPLRVRTFVAESTE